MDVLSPPLTAAQTAEYVVSAAVWAPSVHNTQPWWFGAAGQELNIHADTSRQLPMADPGGVAARRRTHRGGFDPVPLSADLLGALAAAAGRYGATLRIIADQGARAVLAAAVDTAERFQELDGAQVSELVRWASPPGSTRRDGVPSRAYPARPGRTEPHFPGRDFAHGRGWGLPPLSVQAPPSAGVVCLLTTAGDRPADWVNAGQALQRVLLTATTCGVAAALHTQPLELPWRRPGDVLFAAGSERLSVSHE